MLEWWLGTNTSSTTITATPRTCHHTEMPLKIDTRWPEKTLIRPCRIRIKMNSANTTWAS